MAKKESTASDIVARRGLYFQAFGIYEGIAGFYDYGPVGLRIRRKLEAQWRNTFVNRTGALEIETTNIVPEAVLKASGHIDTFTDPITVCGTCKTPFRADKLLEAHYEKRAMEAELNSVKRMGIEHMDKALHDAGIKCEKCGNALGKVEKFNLLFKTQVGPYGGEMSYLRPEPPREYTSISSTSSRLRGSSSRARSRRSALRSGTRYRRGSSSCGSGSSRRWSSRCS